MGNCLKTQLKENVNNDNLTTLGLRVNLTEIDNPVETELQVYIMNSKECKVKTYGGFVGLSYADLANEHTEVTIPANLETPIWFSNGNYKAEITEKYTINKIVVADNRNPINLLNLGELVYSPLVSITLSGLDRAFGSLSEIENITTLELLNLNGSRLSGDIVSLASLVNLTHVNISSTYNISHISGNIESIGALINLVEFDVYNIPLSGTIEGFISAQYANGRTLCNGISSPMLLKYVSFGGQHSTEYYQHIAWESNEKMSVHLGGSTVANSPIVWTKGYTQAEAEAAFHGKTIVRVDA